jgi:hypothetical protein
MRTGAFNIDIFSLKQKELKRYTGFSNMPILPSI